MFAGDLDLDLLADALAGRPVDIAAALREPIVVPENAQVLHMIVMSSMAVQRYDIMEGASYHLLELLPDHPVANHDLAALYASRPDLRAQAVELLQRLARTGYKVGICFHVGSQAMTPHAYAMALERVRQAIVAAAVTVDIVDVGGGFPSTYPGMEPPPLGAYFDVILDDDASDLGHFQVAVAAHGKTEAVLADAHARALAGGAPAGACPMSK